MFLILSLTRRTDGTKGTSVITSFRDTLDLTFHQLISLIDLLATLLDKTLFYTIPLTLRFNEVGLLTKYKNKYESLIYEGEAA